MLFNQSLLLNILTNDHRLDVMSFGIYFFFGINQQITVEGMELKVSTREKEKKIRRRRDRKEKEEEEE